MERFFKNIFFHNCRQLLDVCMYVCCKECMMWIQFNVTGCPYEAAILSWPVQN